MRDTQALHAARDAESNPYARRLTSPKWNRTVTVTDEPRLFARLPEFAEWTKERHLAAATDYASMALALDAAYEVLANYAGRTYGDHGPLVSGVIRDHFPERVKDALRSHAHTATDYRARSLAHWHAGGRTTRTWRQMAESL